LENARKLEEKLKRNGFEDATIVNPEPAEGKLIIVTAVGCDNSKKAKAHLATVSRLAGAMAYVTHK
jgi:cell division septation protein DedD